MNVMMISPYSPRKVTGVGTSIIDLCRKLIKKNTDYILTVPEIDEDLPLDPIFKMSDNYFESPNPKISFIQNLRIIIFNSILLLKKRDDIDVIHLYSIKPTTASGAILARILNKPLTTTIYIIPPPPEEFLRKIINSISIEILLNLTDKFAYETYAAQEQCGNRPGFIIPEGIDVDYFKPDIKLREDTRAKLGIDKNKFVLLYSGRLVESKGIVELLNAVSLLPENVRENFILLLIGNIESDNIGSMMRKLEEKSWFLHHEPVGRDEIKSLYCAADAFVLPSYYEGISSSLIEAMSCELLPIVTNVGGNVEVVKHKKNGFVVERKDIENLGRYIKKIAVDKKTRDKLSKSARKTVVAGFSLEKKADLYMKLYNAISEKDND